MDITLSEQERMLQEQARNFLAKEVTLDLVRAMERDAQGYPPALWKQMAELGWLGIPLPEAYGGAGLGMMELAIIAEEMGKALAPAPFIPAIAMGAMALLDGGSDEQRRRMLPQIARGENLLSIAYLERGKPDLGWVRDVLSTVAHRTKDGYTITGQKQFVPYAHAADDILILAADAASGKATWFIIDRTAPGVSVRRLSTTGADHLCHMELKSVAVAGQDTLSGDGWEVLERAVQRAAVATCAFMTGAAQRVLEITTEYAKRRVQFGRPIGTFQAVSHACADMAVETEGARYITYEAAWAIDQGNEAPLTVSAAKAYVSDAIRVVMLKGHQAHGAIGFSEEHPMPLYSRRAKMGEALFGSASLHRERVAKLLGL
jgi:alkylation response protein AidB-like acyl-CoA dehydrogenase